MTRHLKGHESPRSKMYWEDLLGGGGYDAEHSGLWDRYGIGSINLVRMFPAQTPHPAPRPPSSLGRRLHQTQPARPAIPSRATCPCTVCRSRPWGPPASSLPGCGAPQDRERRNWEAGASGEDTLLQTLKGKSSTAPDQQCGLGCELLVVRT